MAIHFPKFPNESYFMNSFDIIVVYTCQVLICLLGFGITLLTTVWCVYFLSRVREIGRKIHYLKKQREERCYEELINAKVDYIKSIFIAAISALESFVLWFILLLMVIAFNSIPQQTIANCPGGLYFVEEIYHYTLVRGLLALEISSLLIYTSLIHILTSYLSHAYAIKRVISLARRDKVMLAWLFIQLIVIWISIAHWRAFISIIIIIAICLFPIHLCLYIKYSRSLYLLLKWRRLDAWFEDPQSYKRLDGMCKEYKTGSILYVISLISFAITLIGVCFKSIFKMILYQHCMLNEILFDLDIKWLNVSSENKHFVDIGFRVYDVVYNIFALISVSMFILYHLFIWKEAVKRFLKKRSVYKKLYRYSVGRYVSTVNRCKIIFIPICY